VLLARARRWPRLPPRRELRARARAAAAGKTADALSSRSSRPTARVVPQAQASLSNTYTARDGSRAGTSGSVLPSARSELAGGLSSRSPRWLTALPPSLLPLLRRLPSELSPACPPPPARPAHPARVDPVRPASQADRARARAPKDGHPAARRRRSRQGLRPRLPLAHQRVRLPPPALDSRTSLRRRRFRVSDSSTHRTRGLISPLPVPRPPTSSLVWQELARAVGEPLPASCGRARRRREPAADRGGC